MSTITLPNIRVSSDLTVKLKLKDGGVAIDWSTLSNIRVSIYSDAQRSLAGRCSVSIDEEDNTLLVCQYAANKPQYLGVNRVIVQATYMGETKTYDKPAFSFVRWTADQEGDEITIDDPDIDVEISVEDVSSSILQEAVEAAFNAAERAEEAAAAAEHMVDIHTGPEGKSAYEVAVEEGFVGTEEEWLASLKGPVGETPDISIGTVTTVEPGTPADASMGGTPEAPVLNLSIPKGAVGTTPNFTVGTVTTGQPGTPVVVTITGTPEAPVLNVTIPQGMQGNTGSSVDYPYELVNNLTTNDATKGLSAAQGYVLDGKVSQLEAEVTDLDEQVNGKAAVNITGTIPMVEGTTNQYSSGARYVVNIPAGDYLFNIDTTYIGGDAYVYVRINGSAVSLGKVSSVNRNIITVTNDAEAVTVWANAANSPATGNCAFSFSQDAVRGITDGIADLQDSLTPINGKSDSVDIEISLTTSAQYSQNTKQTVAIKAGKYWVDCSPMSLLTISNVYVYVFYESAPSTEVFLGYLSSFKTDYWSANVLQEVTFADNVVALSIYHVANATGAGTLTLSFVDENAVPSYDDKFARLVSKNCPAFTSFKNEETLSPGDVLSLPDVKIIKNSGLFAEISGAVNEVSIGVGYDSAKATNRGYNAYWVVLKPTTLELWWNNNADALIETYNHGLTLDEFTKVSILRKGASCTIRIVTKLGAVYENDSFDWKGVGATFIENNNTSGDIDVSLNFVPRDLSKKIWVFGDSYCGLFNAARWPTQLGLSGIDNYLMNAQGGEAMKAGVYELANVLTLGYIPTYVVWALGMNGSGDPTGQTDASKVADYQKLWLMRFLRICKQNDITPILCTIPSVPALNHHALSSYVRSLGYRYIDFAEAVGSQVDGTWYAGLLSSDNAHPSTEGARVLAMRVLRDFPEIQLMES